MLLLSPPREVPSLSSLRYPPLVRLRRRPADYHCDLVFYIAPGSGFDFYGYVWKIAIIRDSREPQKDSSMEATVPSRGQLDLIRRLVNLRREDFLKDTFRQWCEQFQWCEQYRRMEQTREVISLPRRVPKERECTVTVSHTHLLLPLSHTVLVCLPSLSPTYHLVLIIFCHTRHSL